MRLSDKARKTLVAAAAVLFSTIVLFADLSAGPFIRLPVLFAFPVILVSWYLGFAAGESLAIALPVLRATLEADVPKPWGLVDSLSNTVVLVLTFSLFSLLISQVQKQRRRIRILQGLLPICSFCKKIRTSDEHWEQMENYISRHSEARFSHGICPACAKREYDLDSK
jgi:hypothetical protein